MYELPANIYQACQRYEVIETEGLKLYPIKVNEYNEFLTAKPSIEFVTQTLPVRLLSLPLLEAYYRLDYEAYTNGTAISGLFSRALMFLCLALRLEPNKEIRERIETIRISVDPKDNAKLTALYVTQDGIEKKITPIMFYRLRYVLAAQNGIELVSENANPDLLEAERDIASQNAIDLDINLASQISTVSLLRQVDETEIYEWPILKFKNQTSAIQRILGYIVCGFSEAQGNKWKNGNPYPDPFFSKAKKGSNALIAIDKFAGGEGVKAIQNSNNS